MPESYLISLVRRNGEYEDTDKFVYLKTDDQTMKDFALDALLYGSYNYHENLYDPENASPLDWLDEDHGLLWDANDSAIRIDGMKLIDPDHLPILKKYL